MKKIFLSLLAALVIASCGQPQKDNEERAASERALQEREDAIKQARIDSLALIAWGDLKFGISEDEAIQNDFFKGSKISYESIIIGAGSIYDGGYYGNSIHLDSDAVSLFEEAFGLKTDISSFDAQFEESELTDIVIVSYDYSASHLDDLVDDCHIYMENFKKKMGEPTYVKNDVSILDFDEGEGFIIAEYEVGDKYVSISLHECYSGSEYSYQIHITNKAFPKKKHKYTEEELSKIKKSQKEKDKIMSNSF